MVIDGKYRILDRIGQGGMSVVYLAINEKANKTWAVKEIRKDEGRDMGIFRRSLMAETELLKRLHHPNLPSIVDIIDETGMFLIVMDYIEGNSLEAQLGEKGLCAQEDVIEWGKQLCNVLAYLHSQEPPIIYRDMKPSNIILRPDNTVTLIDFGTARELKEEALNDDTVCLGTPGYAAPEQWGGFGQTDTRTDIYCLGATLYHLVTGHSPAEPVRSWNETLSPGLEQVLLKCMRRDPKERFQSCEELLYALEHYEEMDISFRRKLKQRLLLFLAAAALSFLTGIAALVLNNMERRLSCDTYQAWMERALSEKTREAQIQAYVQAICLEPGQAEAYLELLKRIYLAPDLQGTVSFGQEEDEQLRQLLNRENGDGRTFEAVLKENKEDYDRLAYALGLAYYYYYETEGNKAYAVKWLQAAAASGTLDEVRRGRAARLGRVAEYYAAIGVADKAGDAAVSYGDYWTDLTALTAGNLVEEDNAVTALRMYQELAAQIYTRTQEFMASGVSRESMQDQLANIRRHLDTDFKGVDWEALGLAQLRSSMDGLLEKAKKQIDITYGNQEQGEMTWNMHRR
jgi:serine/threonine-protein kinase